MCMRLCCGVGFCARGLSADLTHITLQHTHKYTHTHTEALTDAAPQMAQMQIARLKVRLRLDADDDGNEEPEEGWVGWVTGNWQIALNA